MKPLLDYSPRTVALAAMVLILLVFIATDSDECKAAPLTKGKERKIERAIHSPVVDGTCEPRYCTVFTKDRQFFCVVRVYIKRGKIRGVHYLECRKNIHPIPWWIV